MFGFSTGKHKRALEFALAACLEPLKDELGNIPIPMQTDSAINGAILGVCEGYANSQGVTKPSAIATMIDGAFEELYRIESINVQNRVDSWKQQNDPHFLEAYNNAKSQTNENLDLTWLAQYADANFDQATGKML